MLSYTIFRTPTGAQLADWSMIARDIMIETTPRGYGTCTATIPLPREIARQWYGQLDNAHLVIKERGQTRYEGRIELPETTPDGLALTAYGYSRAYSDLAYTDVWSTISVQDWRAVTTDELGSRNPDMYEMDTENRLFIGLQKNTTYRNVATNFDVGSMAYELPYLVTNGLTRITGTYSVFLPVNWKFQLAAYTAGYATALNLVIVVGTGALITAAFDYATLAGRTLLLMSVYNDTGGPVTIATENGTSYAKVTNLRMLANPSVAATVTADQVVTTLLGRVVSVNPSQASSTTARIKSPGFDLKEFRYDKAYMEDVLDQLAALAGDGWLWSWRVWDNRILIFDRIANGGQTYQVYATPDISRDLGSLRTSILPTFTDANDDERVAVAQTNTQAESRAGLRRTEYFQAPTTSGAEAQTLAAAYLLDQSIVNAFGDITVSSLWQNGQRVPLGVLRSGDTVQCVEFPATGNSDTDKTRQFRVGITSYDVTNRTLTISPEQRAPKIDSLLARRDVSMVGD